jgi:hypothetical protein
MSELQQRVAPFGLLGSTSISSSSDSSSNNSSSSAEGSTSASSSNKPLPTVGIIMGRFVLLLYPILYSVYQYISV